MELSLVAFALMALAVVITPGPTTLLALSNGSRFGLATAGYGIAGAAISDGFLIAAAALGLGALLTASAFWFAVVKWIGVTYLAWIGVQMLRSAGRPMAVPDKITESRLPDRSSILKKSFLVAVTNPKGYLFFTAFLPQFLILSEPLLGQYFALALVFISIDIAVMAAYAGLGARVVRSLSDRTARWIDGGCGALLVALAGALALFRRSAL